MVRLLFKGRVADVILSGLEELFRECEEHKKRVGGSLDWLQGGAANCQATYVRYECSGAMNSLQGCGRNCWFRLGPLDEKGFRCSVDATEIPGRRRNVHFCANNRGNFREAIINNCPSSNLIPIEIHAYVPVQRRTEPNAQQENFITINISSYWLLARKTQLPSIKKHPIPPTPPLTNPTTCSGEHCVFQWGRGWKIIWTKKRIGWHGGFSSWNKDGGHEDETRGFESK
ncbi:hypothetical protein CEXT_453611 [Caerostris extrusa]|uniref:Uncharacterized protein n=1 Tax=Caerostris extrusa TaxID=172846 RepID=A0AAV4NBU4_CAEEX|nr:hypothetical protein CEXT_453611 [Caerostris extrusa]